MYQFEWPKSDPIEQALRKVQLFCEKYYPNGYTELDLETLIQLGYQTGQYSGLAAQFLEASGAIKILDLKYWQYYYDMLMNNFDFKNYIKTLEPGCGYLPCLGSMIVKDNP